jgi:hypothetical protein
MALTPRIAGTNLVPTGGGRFAANGAVSNVEPPPVNELNQISALIYDGDSEFQYDHFDPRQHEREPQREQQSQQYSGRRNFDRFGRPFEQTPDRRVNNSMLENSSESFAAAFDSASSTSKQLAGEPHRYQPNVALDAIIDTYETTAQVIYDDVPPKGKNLSIVL